MSDPFFVFIASLLGTVLVSLFLIIAPFILQGDGRALTARVVTLLVAIWLCVVMRRAHGRLTEDAYGLDWLAVASGAGYMMVVMGGFATLMGLVRLLCTPLDTASHEREIEEASKTSDEDRKYSRWDVEYHQKRRGG